MKPYDEVVVKHIGKYVELYINLYEYETKQDLAKALHEIARKLTAREI